MAAKHATRLPRVIGAVLREAARPALRRQLLQNPRQVEAIEALVRDTGRPELASLTSLPGEPFAEWCLRALRRVDSERFRHLLVRTHRHAMRRALNPQWREFQYAGFDVRFDIRNNAQWNAFMVGRHQPAVSHWLNRYATPGSTVLDVGANAGVFTLEIARALQGSGRVYAFEPNPGVYEILAENVVRNALQELVVPCEFALGRTDAKMDLNIPEENDGAATLESPRKPGKTVSVDVVAFDSWWKAQNYPAIDLIKIDVEGHEGSVIQAMDSMLQSVRPAIVMEISRDRGDPEWILSRLRDYGYHVERALSQAPFKAPLPSELPKQMDVVCYAERKP